MFKKSIIFFVTGLMVFGCLGAVTGSEKQDMQVVPPITYPMLYTPHALIRINSDADFTVQFSNRTIWNYDINGTGYGICIFIGNCSLPFTIKNCYLHHSSGKNVAYFLNTGLYLYRSSNGTISNNIISLNGDRGIYTYYSDRNAITNNIIDSNADDSIYLSYSNNNIISYNTCDSNIDCGIYLSTSTSNTISNNNARSNTDSGISLSSSSFSIISNNIIDLNSIDGIIISSSSNIIMSNNQITDEGIGISGSSLSYWNTHSISTSNTVNGKPVYYWKNQTSGTVPSGAGQVIITNCSNIKVENQNVSICSTGVALAYSSNCIISHNTANSNTARGVYLTSSKSNTISYNILSSNRDDGIYLLSSSSNTLSNNIASSNTDDGIYLSSSSDNNLTYNNASSNRDDGIYLSSSSNNTVSYNNASSNADDAIYLSSSNSNTISYNDIVSDIDYGIYISGTTPRYNIIHHNNLIDNNAGGKQAYDSSGNNFWNTSNEGNFWSDWVSPDNDSNGIVDFPYYLGGSVNTKDFYPLVDPKFTPKVPSAPLNLKSSLNGMKIILTWQPPSSDGRSPLTNYEVYRSKTSGTEIFISETGNVLTYTDTSVSLGETYYYKVSAKNKIGEGPLSNEISMTIHSTPSAPLNLKTTVNGTQIKLIWNAPKSTDSSIKNYKIFWGTSSGNYTESITIGNITTYSFIDLSRGVRYYFVVCAINFIGEGPKSNEASAIIEQQKNNELIPYSTFMIIIILVIVIIAVIVSIIIFFKKKRKTVPILPTPPPDLPIPRQP